MQILQTTAELPREDFVFETKIGRDDDGAPQYDTALPFEANVEEYNDQYVTMPDGSKVMTPLVLYVVAEIAGVAQAVPEREARVTRTSTGRMYIVMHRNVVTGLDYDTTEPDHFRLKLAEEDAV